MHIIYNLKLRRLYLFASFTLKLISAGMYSLNVLSQVSCILETLQHQKRENKIFSLV